MENVFWIIPDRLAGRSGPTYQPWRLAELREAGIDVVLNLSEFEPSPAEFLAAQLEVAWVPLPDSYPADEETEAACLQHLPTAHAFLQSHLEANRRVLVHCAWGRDRTGLLLAYHLVCVERLSPEAAIARVREVRPKALTALGWEEMAVRVIARLLASSNR
jgi:protein-tyrosine phosphatase